MLLCHISVFDAVLGSSVLTSELVLAISLGHLIASYLIWIYIFKPQ